MEQSPSGEGYCSSASQKNSRILHSLNIHDCIHKSPQLVLILSQINPVHATPSGFREGPL
jgi:hypothetical protein